MLTSGDCARRALCKLAQPFARPGPRCSSVAAGVPRHRGVPVGGAGGDALEEAEHGAHLRARRRAPPRSASRTCRDWRSRPITSLSMSVPSSAWAPFIGSTPRGDILTSPNSIGRTFTLRSWRSIRSCRPSSRSSDARISARRARRASPRSGALRRSMSATTFSTGARNRDGARSG